jgi:hypothetical protein
MLIVLTRANSTRLNTQSASSAFTSDYIADVLTLRTFKLHLPLILSVASTITNNLQVSWLSKGMRA